MTTSNNRIRVLAQALSIDAWHDPFTIDGSTSGVYVELTFREGRIGGDDTDFPFTFRIYLKRALLTVHVESPLTIERSSVARTIQKVQAELLKIRAAQGKAEAHASINIGSAGLGGGALSGAVSGAISNDETLTVKEEMPEIIVNSIPVSERAYSWEMEPSYKPKLEGQPWHPVDEPRLFVKGSHPNSAIAPSVKVTVTCAFEDLIIEDIKPKDPKILDNLVNGINSKTNHAAAVQHLKRVLLEADLEVGALDDRFSSIALANVLAESI